MSGPNYNPHVDELSMRKVNNKYLVTIVSLWMKQYWRNIKTYNLTSYITQRKNKLLFSIVDKICRYRLYLILVFNQSKCDGFVDIVFVLWKSTFQLIIFFFYLHISKLLNSHRPLPDCVVIHLPDDLCQKLYTIVPIPRSYVASSSFGPISLGNNT